MRILRSLDDIGGLRIILQVMLGGDPGRLYTVNANMVIASLIGDQHTLKNASAWVRLGERKRAEACDEEVGLHLWGGRGNSKRLKRVLWV
jgi:hypothetical protein